MVNDNMKYSVLNFKSLNTEKMIDIKPITILCGINSSGKSSIIQSKLLLSQSFSYQRRIRHRYRRFWAVREEKKNPQVLLFEGDMCHLQDFRNVIYENNLDNLMKFRWKYVIDDRYEEHDWKFDITIECKYYSQNESNNLPESLPLVCRVLIEVINENYEKEYFYNKFKEVKGKKATRKRNGELRELKEYIQWKKDIPELKEDFLQKLKSDNTIRMELLINEDNLRYYTLNLSNISLFILESDELRYRYFRGIIDEETFYRIKQEIIEKLKEKIKIENVRVEFQSIFPEHIIVDDESLIKIIKSLELDNLLEQKKATLVRTSYSRRETDETIKEIAENFSEVFSDTLNFGLLNYLDYLLDYYKNIQYIGPLREEPKRFYSFSTLRSLNMGLRGENTTHVLSVNETQPIKFLEIQKEKKIIQFKEKKDMNLLMSLNRWLEIMNLQKVKPEKAMELITKLKILYSKNQPKESSVSIPDVGFGLSQILPVIVGGLLLGSGETLILEQPEIHLHPRMQGDLADFILCNAQLGKRFIIETHSEHFIKRLSLRIAQYMEEDLSKLVSIYFIVPNENLEGANIVDVELNEYGRIVNWPLGFFDDDEDRLLLEASYQKKKYKQENLGI